MCQGGKKNLTSEWTNPVLFNCEFFPLAAAAVAGLFLLEKSVPRRAVICRLVSLNSYQDWWRVKQKRRGKGFSDHSDKKKQPFLLHL